MKQQDFERLTVGYESAVQHPEVSGMEHIQLFQIRSQLADHLSKLPVTQQNRIRQADQVLLANAEQFLQALNDIADLSSWRSRRNAPPTHWWWYLDVIIHFPVNLPQATQTIFAEPALV